MTRQDRLSAITDLETQVDSLRQEVGDLANRLRSTRSPISEPRPTKAEEKEAWKATRIAAYQELAQLNTEIRGKIPSVHLLRHPIDEIIDECCQWAFDGDFGQLEDWRDLIGKVYPIDEQDLQDHGCEPLLAVLRVYKSTLAKLANTLRQLQSAEEPVAVPPESSGPVPLLLEEPKRSRGRQANEQRNRGIAREADKIRKSKLRETDFPQFCKAMADLDIPFGSNIELKREEGPEGWLNALDGKEYDRLYGRIREAREWCKKHPDNSEA